MLKTPAGGSPEGTTARIPARAIRNNFSGFEIGGCGSGKTGGCIISLLFSSFLQLLTRRFFACFTCPVRAIFLVLGSITAVVLELMAVDSRYAFRLSDENCPCQI